MIIRVVFPQLTEERRRDLVKVARGKGEDAKVSIRSIRRHAKDALDKLVKDGETGEDDVHRAEAELEKLTAQVHRPGRRAGQGQGSRTARDLIEPTADRMPEDTPPGPDRIPRPDARAPHRRASRAAPPQPRPAAGRGQASRRWPPRSRGRRRPGATCPPRSVSASALGALIVASLFVYRPSFAVLVGLAVGVRQLRAGRGDRGHQGAGRADPGAASAAPRRSVAAWLRGPDGLVVGDAGQRGRRARLAPRRRRAPLPRRRRRVDASCCSTCRRWRASRCLSVHADDGAARILAFVATVVCSDTGGYATGVLFGRHPLAPIVSKAKTWEGFAGSVLFCCIAGRAVPDAHLPPGVVEGPAVRPRASSSPRRSATSASR